MFGSSLLFILVTIVSFGVVVPFNLYESGHVLTPNDLTIVGGYNASIEDFPHQILYYFTNDSGRFDCGGFIISENFIMTAGHCVESVKPHNIVILAGSTCPEKDGNVVHLNAHEVKIHPNYDKPENHYDVAIIKTTRPIKFTNTMQPVKLPPEGRPIVENSNVTVTGFGRLIEDGPYPDCLMGVDVPIANFEKCKSSYDDIVKLSENMFCAGDYDKGGKDSCEGDSGGAVVQDGMAVGIVSFGNGCAHPKYPGVYTNIAAPAIRRFIKEYTGL